MRGKETRTRFTVKDDQILYDFVKPVERKGGPFKGNAIYQQLEKKVTSGLLQKKHSEEKDQVT
jgi:hypothetical protein